jgi:uncharacterized protein YjeT (DUF2065 family)
LRFKASPDKEFTRPHLKKPHHKKRAAGVAQGVGPELKPQYWKKEKKERESLDLNDTELRRPEFLLVSGVILAFIYFCASIFSPGDNNNISPGVIVGMK